MPKDTPVSSGLQTGDAAIATGKVFLHGIQLISNGGTGTMKVVLYDCATATDISNARMIAKVIVAGANAHKEVSFNAPILASYGLYADVTGTSASYITYYAKA